jgi:hypothetical protein
MDVTIIQWGETMKFQFNDGGRKEAGYRGTAEDCTVRAIAIATERPYQVVYDELFEINRTNNRNPKACSPRDGNTKMTTIRKYMISLGWEWVPTMAIGSGCKVHLRDDELPMGRLVVQLSKHLVAVVDNVIQDTYDCSREGTRCVYGFFLKPVVSLVKEQWTMIGKKIVEFLLEQLMWQGNLNKKMKAKEYYKLLKKLEEIRKLFNITKPEFRFDVVTEQKIKKVVLWANPNSKLAIPSNVLQSVGGGKNSKGQKQ